MITIVEGNPGSGKSFFGVNYLTGFCKYDKMYDEFVLREDTLVISNIEGLRIKHLNLQDCIEKYTVEVFFTVENFEKIQKQYRVKNIVMLIDEAQKIFDSKFYDKDVFYFFQYHRHIGLDIFFLTQSRSTIARQLIPLCEYIVQAKPRSKGVAGTFTYNYIDPKGNYMYNRVLRAKKDVFRAYKSFRTDETNKPRNVLKYYLVACSVILAVVLFLFKSFFAYFKYDSAIHVPKNASTVSSARTASFYHLSSSRPRREAPNPMPIYKNPVPKNITKKSPKPIKPPSLGPVQATDTWVLSKISAFVETASGLRLFVDGREILHYRDFDPDSMTAHVKVSSSSDG